MIKIKLKKERKLLKRSTASKVTEGEVRPCEQKCDLSTRVRGCGGTNVQSGQDGATPAGRGRHGCAPINRREFHLLQMVVHCDFKVCPQTPHTLHRADGSVTGMALFVGKTPICLATFARSVVLLGETIRVETSDSPQNVKAHI